MPYYALTYRVVDDYVTRRAEFREEHLGLARAAHARGELVLAGAYMEPADGALLVWRCDDTKPIEAFVAADPYVRNGLVVTHTIRRWKVVVADEPEPIG